MLILLALVTHVTSLRAPTDRPNFLLSFVDDLGYGDLGVTGHPTTSTPNIDRLSTLGRRLTAWYSGYSVCSASRTALLTGRQPPRVGMPGVINSLGVEGLPLTEQTFANRLSSSGYKSFLLGKWHQGQRPEYLPKARGFDAFYGLPYSVDDGIGYASNCSHVNNTTTGGQHDLLLGLDNNNKEENIKNNKKNVRLGPEIPLPLIQQLPDQAGFGEILEQPTNLVPLSSNMLSFFQNMTTLWRDVPWLAYVAHPHVHTATPNVRQLGDNEQYCGCNFIGRTVRGGFGDALSEVDWMLGEMVDHVASLGLENNTMLLFLSDNGPWLEKHQGGGSLGPFCAMHAPYRNVGKGSTWEGGLRSPSFVFWPGQIAPFTRTSAMLSSLDVLPTLVALAQQQGGGGVSGASPSSSSSSSSPAAQGVNVVLDGMDCSEVLLGSSSSSPNWRHNVLFPFWNGPDFSKPGTEIYAGRYNQYKIHWVTSMGLVSGTHLLNQTMRHDPPLVFDVDSDPAEAFALTLSKEMLEKIEAEKKRLTFIPNAIDPRFGMEWALCCDRTTNCTCDTPREIQG